jgi:hypothetical protein
MVALAFLTVLAVVPQTRHPTTPELVSLSRNELRHLFAALVTAPVADLGHRLRWSMWRRRHQARARTCHYQRQAAQQP